MDLIRDNAEDSSDPNDDGLFSQIIQGKLSPNDYLFAGTPHLVDFFSHDRLEKIITTRSALQSAQHLEKVLGELKNGYSFGGLIINLYQPDLDESAKKVRAVTPGASAASLQKLYQRENETTNTLSPPLFGKISNPKDAIIEPTTGGYLPPKKEATSAEIMSSHLTTRRPKSRPETERRNLGDRLAPMLGRASQIIKVLSQFIVQLLVLIYNFFFSFLRFIVLLFVVVINYQNRRITIVENWRHSWRGFKENLGHLPLMTKFMLFGSIILAAVFVISLVYIRHRQAVLADNLAFSHSLQDLKERRSSVENALIYKNDELALSEFQAARDLLGKIVCNSAERQAACREISSQLGELGVKLRKVLPLNSTQLATLPLPSNAVAGLIKIKNKLIAYSAATSTLFVYDIMNNETTINPTYPSISGFTAAGVPKENDYALFLYNGKQLMQLSPGDLSTKLVDISFPAGKPKISSFVVYNRRLYTLDSQGGMIWKHDAIKTGFGPGSEWLTDKSASLNDSADIAIDGDVFVSKNNGLIAKFTKGISQQFTLLGLDPDLGPGARLSTYNDVPYLYVLDPENKRLIVFEKTGRLVGQLTNDTLKNPTGMVIDSVAKTVYLLDSGRLLKAALQ